MKITKRDLIFSLAYIQKIHTGRKITEPHIEQLVDSKGNPYFQ